MAGFLQGMTSFGFSLIALPLLTLIHDLQLIVPVLVIYSLIMNSTILIRLWREIRFREISWIAVFGILFTPIGMQILIFVDDTWLKLWVGIFIFIFSTLLWFNRKFPIRDSKAGFFLIGALSGILNGSVSLSGPPLVLFMTNRGMEKQSFRASLTFYFWILNLMTIPTFYLGGLITSGTLSFSLRYVVFLIVGVIAGVEAGNRIKEAYFRRLVMLVLMALGIMSAVTASGQIL